MLRVYKRRLLIGLLVLLLLFLLSFFLALFNLQKGIGIFNIGIAYQVEDWSVMIFSILAMLKVLHEIIKVER
jgi:hypothetical protein